MAKHIVTEDEVQKEFDEVQKEPAQPETKDRPNPTIIDSAYVGDLDGDPDNTLPEEEEQETDREERRHEAAGV